MMQPVHQDPYRREVVMARVGHLIRRKQQEVERITRIIRGCFDGSTAPTPEPGRIMRIILIGPYARRSWYEDRHSLYFSDYEFWVIVNQPLFTHERHWGRAEKTIAHEVGQTCAVTLNILSRADVKAARAERDHFVLDRIEAGITLYKASRDAPLTADEIDWWRDRERVQRHAQR
jgi:hypothetical protein